MSKAIPSIALVILLSGCASLGQASVADNAQRDAVDQVLGGLEMAAATGQWDPIVQTPFLWGSEILVRTQDVTAALPGVDELVSWASPDSVELQRATAEAWLDISGPGDDLSVQRFFASRDNLILAELSGFVFPVWLLVSPGDSPRLLGIALGVL